MQYKLKPKGEMNTYKCNHCEVKLYKYAVNAISKLME